MSTVSGELPDSWSLTTLGSVTAPQIKQGSPSGKGEFVYIDISSIDNAAKQIVDPKRISNDDAPSRARQHVFTNDVLVSMTRPNLNAVARVPQCLDGSIASTGFHVLRALAAESQWLFAIVRSKGFVDHMSELVQGALYPAVRPDDIRSVQIPLPPQNEQRRIVAKIEALQARSRKAKEALAELPKLLEQYRQSVLSAAFCGDLTAEWREHNPDVEPASVLLERIRGERRSKWEQANPKKKYVEPVRVDESDLPELPEGWCWSTLQEVTSSTEVICYGVVQPGEPVADGVPLVRVCDIDKNTIDASSLRRISYDIDSAFPRTRLRGGEILVTVVGSIGRIAVVPQSLAGANIARAVARLSPSTHVMPEWIGQWLMTSTMQHWLNRESCEVARKTLNIKELERAPVPLGPTDEMAQAIQQLLASGTATLAVESAISGLVTDVMTLDQSILAKAFRGELVPQDANDEPAWVMLERLQSSGF